MPLWHSLSLRSGIVFVHLANHSSFSKTSIPNKPLQWHFYIKKGLNSNYLKLSRTIHFAVPFCEILTICLPLNIQSYQSMFFEVMLPRSYVFLENGRYDVMYHPNIISYILTYSN